MHIKLVTRNTFKSPRDSISLEFNFEDLEFSKLSEADIFPACKDSNDYRLPSAIIINPILIIFAFIFIRNKHNGKVKPFLIIIVFIVRTFFLLNENFRPLHNRYHAQIILRHFYMKDFLTFLLF